MNTTSPALFRAWAQTEKLPLRICAPSSFSLLVMIASCFGFGPVKTPSVVKSGRNPLKATWPRLLIAGAVAGTETLKPA